MAIGLTYKRQKKYGEAMKCYKKSLFLQPSKIKQITVYNNIAELYRVNSKLGEAEENINKAIEIIKQYHIQSQSSLIAYKTKFEIKIAKGEFQKVIDEVIELHYKLDKQFIVKEYIIQGLEILIAEIGKQKKVNELRRIEKLIHELIIKATDKEKKYINNLKKCLGEISSFLYNLNSLEVYSDEKKNY